MTASPTPHLSPRSSAQDPIVAPQASGLHDSAAAAGQPRPAAVRGQAAAARVLHVGHPAGRAAGVVPHHGAADRPAGGRRAAEAALQRGPEQR